MSYSPVVMIATSAVILTGSQTYLSGGGGKSPKEPPKPDWVARGLVGAIILMVVSFLFFAITMFAMSENQKHVITAELVRYYTKKHKAGMKTHLVFKTTDPRVSPTHEEYLDSESCPHVYEKSRRYIWLNERKHPWYGTNYFVSGETAFCQPNNMAK
jgi:hypothetical protein